MNARPSGGSLASPEVARAARKSAAMMRSEYLASVNSGLLSVFDVVEAVESAEAKPLLKVSLRQLLLAQEGWGVKRTDDALSMVATFTGAAPEKMTIGWLTDPRARGGRLIAFTDALSRRRAPVSAPWPGFPFARKPRTMESS